MDYIEYGSDCIRVFNAGALVVTLQASADQGLSDVFNAWLASQSQPSGPNWEQFKLNAIDSDTLTTILLAVQSIKPQLPGWLYVGLSKAEAGSVQDFALAWRAIIQSGSVPAEAVAGFVQVAQACNLPAEFVAALQPPNP
jgi:hypothetical protein